jgi:hypothetical protein
MNILKNSLIETAEGKPFYNVQLVETADGHREVRILYWHPHRKDWVLTPGSTKRETFFESAEDLYLDAQIQCEEQAEKGDEVAPPKTMHYLGDEYEHRDLVCG